MSGSAPKYAVTVPSKIFRLYDIKTYFMSPDVYKVTFEGCREKARQFILYKIRNMRENERSGYIITRRI